MYVFECMCVGFSVYIIVYVCAFFFFSIDVFKLMCMARWLKMQLYNYIHTRI